MTTVEATQEMATPVQLTEPDELLSEIARAPIYDTLVTELGDPVEAAAVIDKCQGDNATAIERFTADNAAAHDEYAAWLVAWPGETDDEPGQHRTEEAINGTTTG